MLVLPHSHTHPFNGPFSGNTQVSRYQKAYRHISVKGNLKTTFKTTHNVVDITDVFITLERASVGRSFIIYMSTLNMTFVYEFFKELVTKIKEFLRDIKTNIEYSPGV